jgi:hypothetical protein
VHQEHNAWAPALAWMIQSLTLAIDVDTAYAGASLPRSLWSASSPAAVSTASGAWWSSWNRLRAKRRQDRCPHIVTWLSSLQGGMQPHYPQPPAGMQQYGQMPRTQEYQRTATIRNQVNLKKQVCTLPLSSMHAWA